ncbi:AAA family ATPase [Salinibacillus xinjiangensis]|uniref:AAA domain-containing protein n=1 Tax=Salinibacillus xinjiangensis TaxID=1229268 RepID=A0A6G1X4D6_9BACI|nr:MoxR family ATPase [Salinibacillus xinjiangensis]MRG85824.1 AAA domain-containing protein [Salinibacillus xinjiangensis]
MIQEQLPTEIQEYLEKQSDYQNDFEHLYTKDGFIETEGLIHKTVISYYMGKNILLKGPTGSGKTKLAETISAIYQKPMHSINCSVDLDAESLLGFKTIREQDGKSVIEFVEGPVVQAMKNGHTLYIDEINMARPETLPILNGVLDYRKTITNPFTNEVIKAHKDFRVISAINEGYIGTTPLNEALKNRFVIFQVSYLTGDQLKEVIRAQTKLTDNQTIEYMAKLADELIEETKKGKVSEEAASTRALLDACDLAVYLTPLTAIEHAISEKLDDEREKSFVMNLAETYFKE